MLFVIVALAISSPAFAQTETPSPQPFEGKYTDEDAADILKRLIAHEGDGPLPAFEMRRFTHTQALLVFTAMGAHLDRVTKIYADKAAASKQALESLASPPKAAPQQRGPSALDVAILSSLLKPQPPITAPPPYQMPTAPLASATAIMPNRWIDGVDGNGAIVRLNDGSVWQVNELDRLRTALWLPIQRIVVTQSGIYGEWLLVNESRSESSRARRVR